MNPVYVRLRQGNKLLEQYGDAFESLGCFGLHEPRRASVRLRGRVHPVG